MADNKKKKAAMNKKQSKKNSSIDNVLLLSMDEQRDIGNLAAITRGNKSPTKNNKKLRKIKGIC
jgi:hypothetical protein